MNDREHNIRNQFSKRAKSFDTAANWMLNDRLINAHLVAAGSKPNGHSRSLDLCCGTGILGKAFLARGWEVNGVDLTKEMADEAGRHFKTIVSNIEKLPYEDNSFDVAYLRQSYMLVDGPKALNEIKRILRPGGIFVFSQSVAFSDEEDGPQYEKIQTARHINMVKYYKTGDLVSELEVNGFKVEHKDFLQIPESVDCWLNNALALSSESKEKIFNLIANAPENYKKIRNVRFENGKLYEDWNWVIITART